MEDVRRNVAELFGEAGYISVDILDRVIYSQNHSVRSNSGENGAEYISLGLLDRTVDSEKRLVKGKNSGKPQNGGYISLSLLDKKPQKYRCEHLSRVLECFAGGFGRISCFDPNAHEICQFKTRHKRMVAENDRIRENMKKFESVDA